MKARLILVVALVAGLGSIAVRAQESKPGVAAAQAVETVVTVIDVDHQARTVTLKGPEGRVVTMQVPPQAQNLDQVHPGAKFRVRYLQSVAVYISGAGGEPSAQEGATMQLAEKGATPAGAIATVRQVQARVDAIDYDTREVVLTGPAGQPIKVTVDPRVQRLNEVKQGDMVVVRYTEALAMKMIEQ
jgi:hypothetical protein